MRHGWTNDHLVVRHVAALPLGGLFAISVALAFARAQPWAQGLSFVGSLWLAIALWLFALVAAYMTSHPRALTIIFVVATCTAWGVP